MKLEALPVRLLRGVQTELEGPCLALLRGMSVERPCSGLALGGAGAVKLEALPMRWLLMVFDGAGVGAVGLEAAARL